jgi:hypothetical protein
MNKKGTSVIEHRKQAISIRLAESDVRNVKRVAKRLGVRDSDIVRYAIKTMLARIAPLCDEAITGRNLVPVLVESGDELIRHFELDAYRLERIINEHAHQDVRVDRDDIALLAMSGLREHYLVMRMKDESGASEGVGAARSLRNYLYDKYVYRNSEPKAGEVKRTGEVEVHNGLNGNGHNGHDELSWPAAHGR